MALTPNWNCRNCARELGATVRYPPSPDVYCARCGAPLGVAERGVAVLRDLVQLLAEREQRPSSGAPPSATTAAADLLTVAEVAELLRTSRKAIYTRIERGQLPGVTRDRDRVLVKRAALVKYLRENSVPSPGEP